MNEIWLGACAVLALTILLVLIIRFQVHAFIVLLLVSLGLGLAAGLAPDRVIDSINKGVGDILREVAVLLVLGAILGRMLESSGAAELIARRLLQAFGDRQTSLALLLAAFLVGIPIMFNIGFLVLLPIVYRLQKETGRSLLFFLCPMSFGLSMTHSLVPPHPGIVGAVQALAPAAQAQQIMVQTILFGTLLAFPATLVGWYGPARWWASRQFVAVPERLAGSSAEVGEKPAKSFLLALSIVLAPLVLSLAGFGADLMHKLDTLPDSWAQPLFDRTEAFPAFAVFSHSPLTWMKFLGKPTVALLVPTALACILYGLRLGWTQAKLAKVTNEALTEIGSMTFLFGAAGGFKEVLVATGVGDVIARGIMSLPLSPLISAYVVAVACRIALGSATASILTASALLTEVAGRMPGHEVYLILAVASGVTFMTQPADSGFWMIKEYGNVSVNDVMIRFNGCRVVMSLTAVTLLWLAERTLYAFAG